MTRDPLGDPYTVARHWQRWAVEEIIRGVDGAPISLHNDQIDAIAHCARLNQQHHTRWAAKQARRAAG